VTRRRRRRMLAARPTVNVCWDRESMSGMVPSGRGARRDGPGVRSRGARHRVMGRVGRLADPERRSRERVDSVRKLGRCSDLRPSRRVCCPSQHGGRATILSTGPLDPRAGPSGSIAVSQPRLHRLEVALPARGMQIPSRTAPRGGDPRAGIERAGSRLAPRSRGSRDNLD
jgi:hypothetical protein